MMELSEQMAKNKNRQTKKEHRWGEARNYLERLSIDEVRRFYARGTKFMLDPRDHDAQIDSAGAKRWTPNGSDPQKNFHQMRLALNEQNSIRIRTLPDNESKLEAITRIARPRNKRTHHKARTRKKHIKRYTVEAMWVIREMYDSGTKHRVVGMKEFSRLINYMFNRK